MKRIVIFILLFSLFSCDKDEPTTLSAKYSKEQIFNAVVGTWKFNRLAYDAEFKKIRKVEAKECAEYDRSILRKDGTITRTTLEGCDRYEPNKTGTFTIRIGGYRPGDTDGIYIYRENSGMYMYPGHPYRGWLTLHSFTDSTLVFSDVTLASDKGQQYDEDNLFSELKRVKE